MAKTYAGSDAALTMGLIMAAHMVSAIMQLAFFTNLMFIPCFAHKTQRLIGKLG